MPIFRLCTNLPRSKIPKNFHVDLHKLIARMLQKPEKSVCVSIQPDELMLMQGTEEPAVSCSFLTIGRFGPEANVGYSKELCTQIVDKLQVKPDRIKIHFIDEVSSNVGTEFTTISNLQTP